MGTAKKPRAHKGDDGYRPWKIAKNDFSTKSCENRLTLSLVIIYLLIFTYYYSFVLRNEFGRF